MPDDNPLKTFKGITPEKDKKQIEAKPLGYLIGLADYVLEHYRGKEGFFFVSSSGFLGVEDVYNPLQWDLEHKLLKDIEFDDNDLRSLILSIGDKAENENQSAVLGMYTGALLQILTKRNRKMGERTMFYMDGNGRTKFDYLFAFAKEIDSLILTNFVESDCMCYGVGYNKGEVGFVLLANNSGDCALRSAGQSGKAGLLMLVDHHGENSADDSVYGGVADIILVAGNKGNRAASVAQMGGSVGMLAAIGNKGNYLAGGTAEHRGKAGLILIADNDGDYVAFGVGQATTHGLVNGNPEVAMKILGPGKVNKIVMHNPGGPRILEGANADRVIVGDKAVAEYKQINQQYGLGEMIDLARSIKGRTAPEAIAAATQIRDIYETLKPSLGELREG